MIQDRDQFKLDRLEVIKTKDISLLRSWAAKYGVRLPADDLEAMV